MPDRLPGLRRLSRAALLAVTVLILASCSRGTTVGGAGQYAAPHPAGHVKITQLNVGDVFPTEGAVSYFRVSTPAGATVLTKRLPDSKKLLFQLKPGDYRLVSWQRTCDANCGNLDPPSNRCAGPITVKPHQQLNVTIRLDFASGCTIVTGG